MSDFRYIVHRLRETKVLQNYSYMSLLSIFSALVGLLIYPYLIRVLGAEAMGTYAFLLGVTMYFQALVEFGFDMPSVKAVSLAHDKPENLDRIVSTVMVAKMMMLLFVSLLALVLVCLIPMLRSRMVLFCIVYLQVVYTVLFPQWYYQGMKNMRFATLLQLLIRLTQVPLILWWVHTPDDLNCYAWIVSGTMLLGGVVGGANLLRDGRRWTLVRRQELWQLFVDAWPFFLTSISSTIKERTLTTLIGVRLGMTEVAVYDLAMKVVQIPRLLINSINGALFPEVVGNATEQRVRKILHYERLIGVCSMLAISLLGYPVVWLLGGSSMMSAYPVAVVLSFTIYSFLVVGAYLQFVFIARGEYRVVAYNQLIAMVTCLLICVVGTLWFPSAWMAAASLSLSGGMEIVYCKYRKRSL